ncbi:unnamed protein product [Absidia cylindrospora]
MTTKSDSILGDKVAVVKNLDNLFQNSAGPSDTLSKPVVATPIVPFESPSKKATETDSKKRKKIDTTVPNEDDVVAIESLRKRNRPAVLTGEKQAQQKAKDERTIFVGNLPFPA